MKYFKKFLNIFHSLIYIVNSFMTSVLLTDWTFKTLSNKSWKIFLYMTFSSENLRVLDNKHRFYFLNRKYINLYFQKKSVTTATFTTFVANRMLYLCTYIEICKGNREFKFGETVWEEKGFQIDVLFSASYS